MIDSKALLKESYNDTEWLNKNNKDIIQKYNGKFIAVRKKRVIASANNLDELSSSVKKEGEEFNLCLVELVTSNFALL